LTYRYINGKTWEEIAVEMHYTYKWVHVLHGQALAEFENVLRMRQEYIVVHTHHVDMV